MSLNLVVFNKNKIFIGGDGACTHNEQRVAWNLRKVHATERVLISAVGYANICADIVERFDSLDLLQQNFYNFKNVVENYNRENNLSYQSAGKGMYYVFCFAEWDGKEIVCHLMDSTGALYDVKGTEEWAFFILGVEEERAREILTIEMQQNNNIPIAMEQTYKKMQGNAIGGKCCIYKLDRLGVTLQKTFLVDTLGSQLVDLPPDKSKYYTLVAENININSLLQVINAGGTTKISGGVIQTGSISADKINTAELKVNAANITGVLSAGQIDAQNLRVNAANIVGTLQANQIDANNLRVNAANITGTLQANQIDAQNLRVNAANIVGTLSAGQIDATGITAGQINVGNGNITLQEYGGDLYANFSGGAGSPAWSKSLTRTPAAYNAIGVNNATWAASAERSKLTFRDSSNIRLSTDSYEQEIMFVYSGTPSDARLKENIVPTNSVMEVLNGIEIADFNYRNDVQKHTGVIAQQLQEVFPNAVTERGDGYLGIDYTVLVPLLIKGFQEQQAEIVALTVGLETLREKLTEQQQANEKLQHDYTKAVQLLREQKQQLQALQQVEVEED